MKIPLPRLASIAFSALGSLVSIPLHGSAAELHVPADFPTIQAALNTAVAGDEIRVSPGTYRENLDFKQKNVSLTGTGGAESTVIDAALGTGVIIGPAGSITGFTIRNARASFGAGMSVRGNGTRIAFNIFEDNAQTGGGYGAAIGMNSSSPIIESNIFRRNTADSQHLSGVICMVNGSSPYIANNIIYNNPTRAINVVTPTSARPVIINNTIVGNGTGVRVGNQVSAANQIYRNNIIHGNVIGFHAEYANAANYPTWQNNLVSGNGTDYLVVSNQTGINGNITGDPLFENPAEKNYRLRGGSPAIDAGNNLLAPPVDYEGTTRPFDGNGDGIAIVDIGAYELTSGNINLIVEGGELQECLSPQGNTVEARVVLTPEDLEIASVELFLNGASVATTLTTQVTLPMGDNLLEAVVILPDGYELRSARTVVIVDTTAPVIDARFVDRRTGRTLTSIDANGMTFVTVKIDADDACDPDPEVESMLGTEVRNDDPLRFIGQLEQLRLNTDKLTLKVMATDASGNVSVQTKHLVIDGRKSK